MTNVEFCTRSDMIHQIRNPDGSWFGLCSFGLPHWFVSRHSDFVIL